MQGHSAQRISYNIGFTLMVTKVKTIILHKFEPPPLPHIQLSLTEQVLQTLMITEYFKS